MSTKILDVGTSVAFVAPAHSWVMGKVAAYDVKAKLYTCTATEPEAMKVEKVKPSPDAIWAPRLEYMEEDVDDLLQLTELHEASLLFCLKRRYFRDVVYTNIGPIVVALNPFNFNIPHYMDSQMPSYLHEGVVVERNLPHTWAVAHNTYYEMVENSQNQTILISGESGAGKTEAAKIVVKYLGHLSTLHGTVEQQAVCALVNKRVNAASPILEAFGNAKTVRNDNSSRFGKFARIQFDRDGFLVGSFATKYLLEKSRIISAANNERVYHSFYQLVFGADHKDYNLRSSKLFGMLSSGSCETIEGVDDAAEYQATVKAMDDVGMSEEEKKSVWRTVAGILFLQNLEFREQEEKSGKVASIDEAVRGNLSRACDSWDVDEALMERELLSTTIVLRGESTPKPHSKVQALDTRDSVSRNLYDWLFEWIVNKINQTTNSSASCAHWIGLLDIFGFEDFEYNSFEQLCINLANETLQNHYNNFIFTQDMKECAEEGIDTTAVTFVDNKACIELLTGKIGILSLLDEECLVNGTIGNYLQKITANFLSTRGKEGHPYFAIASGKSKDNCFKIKHYAADVTYNIDKFMDKNRETIKDAMKLVLGKSGVPLIRSIVPTVDDSTRTAKVTVGGFFKLQLQELMAVINSTNPHWIRCIKPHPAKKPRMFSHLSVMTQLRSAGVLDTVKVRKAGYPIRFKRDTFLMRYRILVDPRKREREGGSPSTSAGAAAAANVDPMTTCRAIFERLGITAETGQLGKTKVFLRQEAFLRLNHAKDEATLVYSVLFQAIGRASAVRAGLFTEFVRVHRARILAERKAREEALRRAREEEERRRREEEEAAARRERLEAMRTYSGAVALQRHIRGALTRCGVVRMFVENGRAAEERRCDDAFQRFRSTFDEVDLRVRHVERAVLERQRLQAVEAANEDLYTVVSKRRQLLAEKREMRRRHIEEVQQRKAVMLEKEIKATKARAREEAEAQRRQLMEQDARARERRQALLAAKEGHEELMVERLERRRSSAAVPHNLRPTATELSRAQRQQGAQVAQERSDAARRHSAEDFARVKREWELQELWTSVRERRFADDAEEQRQQQQRDATRRRLAASRQYAFPPSGAAPPPPSSHAGAQRGLQRPRPISELTGGETLLTTTELLLEAQFRSAMLHEAHNAAETELLLRERRRAV